MDLFPLSPSEVIPEWTFWGILIFWGTLTLLFELFKKRKLHLHLAAVCCPRYLTEAELEMMTSSSEAKLEFDSNEASSLEMAEKSKLLSTVGSHYRKLILSMGDSFVCLEFFHTRFQHLGITHDVDISCCCIRVHHCIHILSFPSYPIPPPSH